MRDATTIVWFRQDLRLTDNPALSAAVEQGCVIPVYILSIDEESPWKLGGASRWWLHQSLTILAADLERRGSRLILRSGNALETLQQLIAETGATSVYWNRRYEPTIIKRDKTIKQKLHGDAIDVESFNGSLLFEPWEIATKQGDPYKVFTPFWKSCLARTAEPKPLRAPRSLRPPSKWPRSEKLTDWHLEPKIRWDEGMRKCWDVGENAAGKQLVKFAKQAAADYEDQRNLMAEDGTSRLSPHLHFGEISPRQVWAKLQAILDANPDAKDGADTFLSEIGWREFAYHLLYHFPHTTKKPLRENFVDFPWSQSKHDLHRWQRGETGYPVVDAAMRQLWHTGWMHNRARMIVASFLCKHLRIPWQRGAKWFWDTLVDADLASNTLGWQWTAGCGADAAPYFRIFNPMTQGEKFDPTGAYIRQWVPELAELPTKWLYKPWEAPDSLLNEARVTLGDTYPTPIVDHGEARQAALDAYEKIKKS